MLKAEHRASMRFFMHEFLEACRKKAPVQRKSAPLSGRPSPRFTPSLPSGPGSVGSPAGAAGDYLAARSAALRTVLLTDEYRKAGNLSAMIDVFVCSLSLRRGSRGHQRLPL